MRFLRLSLIRREMHMHNPVEIHRAVNRAPGIRRFGKAAFAVAGLAVAALALMAATSTGQVSSEALMSKLHWRLVGPFVGGRVVAVAGVPSDPNLFYMSSTGGGIWKSTDYGIKWVNISDGHYPSKSQSIGAIAVAPS